MPALNFSSSKVTPCFTTASGSQNLTLKVRSKIATKLFHCIHAELTTAVGLQLLHAVYIVEAFLYDLLQRKCVFNIVFIEQHSGLCVPAKVLPSNKYKFHLARAVIVRHLRIHLSKPYANVSVYEFESLQDARLTAYLKHAGAYFVLCHDGADAPSSQNSALGSKRGEMTKRSFRAAIASFMNNGYDVALINDLKFQDTKVCGHRYTLVQYTANLTHRSGRWS